MEAKIQELSLDLDDLRRLLSQTARSRVICLLEAEIKKVEAELKAQDEKNSATTTKTNTRHNGCYDTKITNYAWDQSETFLKLYVSLTNAQTVDVANIKCEFTPKSVELVVSELDGKNHILLVTNLMNPITPEGSHYKVKKDMVVLFLKKQSNKKWSDVTVSKEKKEKDIKKPDANADPNQSLMEMMKKMYDEGDDDMKRTIAKAWTESRDKKQGGPEDF